MRAHVVIFGVIVVVLTAFAVLASPAEAQRTRDGTEPYGTDTWGQQQSVWPPSSLPRPSDPSSAPRPFAPSSVPRSSPYDYDSTGKSLLAPPPVYRPVPPRTGPGRPLLGDD